MANALFGRATSPDDALGDAAPVHEGSDSSRGSSVSSRLQNEYDNVLKSAVLMPNVENIPGIVEQFLGSVAREVDTYPQGHAFSAARLVDISDDENPRSSKPQVSTLPPTSYRADSSLVDGTDGIVDVLARDISPSVSDTRAEDSTRLRPTSAAGNKSKESRLYFGTSLQVPSSTDMTSSESEQMFRHGALPRSRFIPEKTDSHPEHAAKNGQSRIGPGLGKVKSPSRYTVPRTVNIGQDTSESSALDQLASTDGELARTENLLDQWSGELKRNILAEFGQAKCRIAGNFHNLLNKEKDRHKAEHRQLREETDSLRELLATYELSLSRKDQVITNLTQSLHRHRDRLEMQKRFTEWRQQHADRKREAFCSKLAAQHYERTLYRLVWNAWHSILVGKWRHRVERACQAKAQEVCLQLTNDYEAKIASVNEALEASRVEVQRLHREREWYEENMKKAFMRGVCALNMEALGMFRPPDDRDMEETADATSEVEACEAEPMTLPFFASVPGGAGNSSTGAPVYTVTREASLPSKPAAFKKQLSENTHPHSQKVIRAQIIARDNSRPGSSPLTSKSHEPAKRTVPLSPSCKSQARNVITDDSRRVHFSQTKH